MSVRVLREAGATGTRVLRTGAMAVFVAGTAGCRGGAAMLEPAGPAASPITDLWWLLLWTTGIVTAVVFVLFFVAAVRSGRKRDDGGNRRGGLTLIVVGGALIPAVILAALLWSSVRTGRLLAQPEGDPAEEIVVIGHQYWWEVRYPAHGFVTANEIHIPAGRPVRITLDSRDVIHSLWVPELAGKLDLVPGRTNQLWLQADSAGVFRGLCAEYCGIQHTRMAFLVIAQPPDEFARWVARQRLDATPPESDARRHGLALYVANGCAECHRIAGVVELPAELGAPGPDLTHIGSRRTLAAVTVPNTADQLARWIAQPGSIKRGSRMPPTRFDEDDMLALIAFLMGLQ